MAFQLQPDEPLTWQTIKSAQDDPEAALRVEALINSVAYQRADQDIQFLSNSDVRGARIQLDYLKPELHLRAQGVEHTIVVFGSTRLLEPAAAARKVLTLETALAVDPANSALAHRLSIARRVQEKSVYYEMAREFGAIVGRSGGGPDDCRVTLMTGGGPGIMEAANRGAFDVGAKNIGLNIDLPREQYPNSYISEELCFSVHYFAIRKLHFLLRAKALVVFPGGFGTMDELFETLTLIQSRTIAPLPVILVGERYWQQAFNLDFLVEEGVIAAEDRKLFWYSESAQQIWDQICEWHDAAGTPLLCEFDRE